MSCSLHSTSEDRCTQYMHILIFIHFTLAIDTANDDRILGRGHPAPKRGLDFGGGSSPWLNENLFAELPIDDEHRDGCGVAQRTTARTMGPSTRIQNNFLAQAVGLEPNNAFSRDTTKDVRRLNIYCAGP